MCINKLQAYTKALKSCDLMGRHYSLFLGILTTPPPGTKHAICICLSCKTTTVCKRIFLVPGGGEGVRTHLKKKRFQSFPKG